MPLHLAPSKEASFIVLDNAKRDVPRAFRGYRRTYVFGRCERKRKERTNVSLSLCQSRSILLEIQADYTASSLHNEGHH